MGFSIMVSPKRGQGPHFPLLIQQASVYNLTLDEVQSQLGDLGKPLSTMNLDELLKSVIAAEDRQVNQNTEVSTCAMPSSSSTSTVPGNVNLSQTETQKTVDEVWKEIVKQENGNASEEPSMQRQQTLGEMTLEDFLVRTGAITMGSQGMLSNPRSVMKVDSMDGATQPPDWLHYQMSAINPQQLALLGSSIPVAGPVFGNPVSDDVYAEMPMSVSMPTASTTASDSQAVSERKRKFSDEMMEKSIERRQRRMIKNRESAARSRQRKQAYTNQLEQEVSNLRKTNQRLKKQAELEMHFTLCQSQEPAYQLRRSTSTSF
ncbi:ABSCISIC ACID-INSENSITIVE 5-like protein 2 [Aristolochia californica]|uniref:ABSCISIC ACID-INSENSITIVE 5-like protein 2 n=1 Tax=Aristolochia californica TaxID=171875 RepID=UPI0035D5528F